MDNLTARERVVAGGEAEEEVVQCKAAWESYTQAITYRIVLEFAILTLTLG